LLVSSIALLILKRNSLRRKNWVRAGLIISSVYLIYALAHKFRVDQVVKNSLQDEKTDYRNFIATPTPLNNFLWYVVVDCDSGYNVGYYSVFDHQEQIRFHYVSKNDFLVSKTEKETHDIKKLIRFSQGYYRFEKTKATLVFNDLRFGQIGGWYDGNAPFVFQFGLSGNTDHDVLIQQGRMKA